MSSNPESNHTALVVGLGEILWDLLPDGKVMGGAPANFAFHAAQLGHESFVASRIGSDELGQEISERLTALGLSCDHVQRDPHAPTGTVEVTMNPGGGHEFRIIENVAWDNLEWNSELELLAKQADAVCFGTLASRAPQSQTTIQSFLNALRPDALRIFDVNLRGDFYSSELIESLLAHSTILKVNDEEFPRLAQLLELKSESLIEGARELIPRYELDLLCITRGDRGSLLITPDELDDHPGFPTRVADTIGSGDAFVATLAHHRLIGSPLSRINAAANRLGSYVASQRGATPKIPNNLLAEIE